MPKSTETAKYLVYLLVFSNGKVYVGMTGGGFKKRMREHKAKSFSSCSYALCRAIQKYTWESVKGQIIKEYMDKEDAESLEKHLISYFNSTSISFGYNLAIGGLINRGYKIREKKERLLSKEDIEKRSKKCSDTKKSNVEYYREIASMNSTRYSIIAVNIHSGEKFYFRNASKCEDELGFRRGRVYDKLRRNSRPINGKWEIIREKTIKNN